jgi:thermostable 8-oxoguanine DNA glycosylase
MNLYNRYLMRTSGEQKHQARTSSEKATFAIVDFLLRKKVDLFKNMEEDSKNKLMEEINSCINTAMIEAR